MQWAGASVVVETVGGVGLLLCLDDDRTGPEGVHGAAGNINHFTLKDINPVEKLFSWAVGAIVVDGLRELLARDPRLQAERNLRSGPGVGNVPTFSLTPRLAEALRGLVVGMNLHRKFFLGKQELQQQWKAPRITRGRAHEFVAKFLAQIGERALRQRTICDHAVVASQPGFSDAFVEFVIGVDGRKVHCAPRAGVEGGLHQEWIELDHGTTVANTQPVMKPTA